MEQIWSHAHIISTIGRLFIYPSGVRLGERYVLLYITAWKRLSWIFHHKALILGSVIAGWPWLLWKDNKSPSNCLLVFHLAWKMLRVYALSKHKRNRKTNATLMDHSLYEHLFISFFKCWQSEMRSVSQESRSLGETKGRGSVPLRECANVLFWIFQMESRCF